MIVYCDCLNVKIEAEGNDFDKVTLDTRILSQEELNEEFFQKVSRKIISFRKFFKNYHFRILFD